MTRPAIAHTRYTRFALVALVLVALTGCASAGGGAAPATGSADPLPTYINRLEVAKTAYNATVDAYTAAARSGLVTYEQQATIEPLGAAAEQSLRAATFALEAWALSRDPAAKVELDVALLSFGQAILALSAQWQEVSQQ